MSTMRAENGKVVWSMSPADARDLARWMDEVLSTHDLARQDAVDLVRAADQADPANKDSCVVWGPTPRIRMEPR